MWLKARDHNSRFFHAMATSRRRNNLVSKIRDDKGYWQEKEEDISKVFLSYFKEAYTTSNPTNMELILEIVERKIDEIANEALLQ